MAQAEALRPDGKRVRARHVKTVRPDGEAIRTLREHSGLTVVQLGKLTGRHPQTIRNLELEHKLASVILINQIARALNVAVDDITKSEHAA